MRTGSSAVWAVTLCIACARAAHAQAGDMAGMDMGRTAGSGAMIVPMLHKPMLPGMANAAPKVQFFQPGALLDLAKLPVAQARRTMELKDGDTLELRAETVRHSVNGKPLRMYAFNRQIPGPLLRV